jgi:hypothetical protein
MSLFINKTPSFEKLAYEKLLEKDPSSWPVGIIKEAYNQLPYLRDYELDVTVDRTDEARGYGVGKLLVYPARMDKKAAAKEDKLISFPIIIRDRSMAPLDVISYKDQIIPESQEKVAQILHQPDTFRAVSPQGRYGAVEMITKVNPPTASGQQTRYSGYMGKSASVSLTKLALHTFDKQDVDAFLDKVASDAAVRHTYSSNETLREYMGQFKNWSEKTAEDRWVEFTDGIQPTVLQFTQEGMGYRVKYASHKCYAPKTLTATRFEVQEALSKEAMEHLLQERRITLSTDPVQKQPAQVKTASKATRPGIYSVKIASKDVEGVVIPKMIDFDGRLIDSQLFIGPAEHAMQDQIVGSFVKSASLTGAYPRGRGVFVHKSGDLAVATEPVEVTNISTTHLHKQKLASLHGRILSTGLPVTFSIVPGLQKIANIANQVIAIPETFEFLPINGKQVRVSSEEALYNNMEVEKSASAPNATLVSDGASFGLRGDVTEAIGSHIMNEAETEFALGALGLTGNQASHLMKKASAEGQVRFRARKVVSQESVKLAYAQSMVQATPNQIAPLRVDLIKEASVIVDKETVDSILSLQFMNPSNVGMYVDYISDIENAMNKVAEVLVAARLGMDDIKESAAKTAMTQLHSVLGGLKNLRDKVQA